MLVPRLVIFFSVVNGGYTVLVRCQFVELRGSLMRIIWHNILSPTLAAYFFESSPVKWLSTLSRLSGFFASLNTTE